MKLYRTREGVVLQDGEKGCRLQDGWDAIARRDDLYEFCREAAARASEAFVLNAATVLAPVVSQEVWAAGVTYFRSRAARMEESREAGGGDFYDRIYHAERPELFFKSLGGKVVGPGENVRIRRDASWSVPEPELTLLVSAGGKITGYTLGNDMSSRDIEGENPLYLPQAKVYSGSCAVGPCIYVPQAPLLMQNRIAIEILRHGEMQFSGNVALTELKRDLSTLVSFLYRENEFPDGCLLMTGTGIVPPDSFSLRSGDEIRITLEAIGSLVNRVA